MPGAAGTWKDLTGQREPARREPDDPGARDRRSGDRRDQGRPDAVDPGRGARRGGGAEGQHQHDDRQPARDDGAQPGAGLAEDEPREVHPHAAGPARPRHRRPMLLSELAPLVDAQQGAIYQMDGPRTKASARCACSPATRSASDQPDAHRARRRARGPVRAGEAAHSAHEGARRLHARSSRASARRRPANIVVLPVLFEGETKAVIELASLQPFTATHLTFLEQLTQSIGVVLNTIEATMRTEDLLQQSQQLTSELQTRQTRAPADQRGARMRRPSSSPSRTRRWSGRTRRWSRRAARLEEKAAELALTSKYKSEFLANMSHELRTPLNSILILGQQLAENDGGNLTPKQVEFAQNIHSAGTDLLTLINDILDLSKIESGTVTVEAEEITFASLRDSVRAHVPPRGRDQEARRSTSTSTRRCRDTFTSDPKRLQQILKNLLSNAFKFTAQGQVSMSVQLGCGGLVARITRCSAVAQARRRVRRSATRASASRPRSRGSSSRRSSRRTPARARKYGGTGLGLAISRELATLLGGEIRLASSPGQGSTFTLYLPLHLHRAGAVPSRRQRHRATVAAGARIGRCPCSPSRKAEEIVADDRDEHREGDTVAAHRGGRPALRAGAARPGARQGLQGHRRQRGQRRSRSRGSTGRRRSRWTSSCRTCSAGRCSTT